MQHRPITGMGLKTEVHYETVAARMENYIHHGPQYANDYYPRENAPHMQPAHHHHHHHHHHLAPYFDDDAEAGGFSSYRGHQRFPHAHWHMIPQYI
ncbi:unnamed protein product [Adineta steineri]|uniref:Uncharacterized protein n=2 Tax=Adineta steineri TaxID=433720 RepID=A0A815IJ75_9BILA|nr:unnamed protein product [Adineta steineri]